MSDLVTGEAVVLELRLAKLASRSLALAIDVAVQLTLLLGGTLVLSGALAFMDETLATAVALVFYVSVVVGYPVTFETATRGRTLGKMALGLRVVRDDGGSIRFRHALVRGLLAVVEIWITFGSVALITSLASAQGKRLGDYLAGTVVVRERVPVRAAPVAAMPPPLAAWAATLDLSRLPDDLALAARQFLARSDELAPAVREEMGARLAASVAAVTAPAPPPGTPAWAFLSAVLAERRRRDLERLGAGRAPGGHPAPAGSAPAWAPSRGPAPVFPAAAQPAPAAAQPEGGQPAESPPRPTDPDNPFAPPG